MQDTFDPDFAAPSEWAWFYRSLGIQAVPNRYPMATRGDKRPNLKTWKLLEDGLVSDETFAEWYGPRGVELNNPNIGVITGRCSDNLFVIDLDTHSSPDAALWWQGVLGMHPEPETWKQTTGGGGVQLFFRAPYARKMPTCRTALGVDIRGQGGYAVLPPTRHMSGKSYQWAHGCEPWNCELAEAPEWLLEAIDELVNEHGGSRHTAEPVTRTASPDLDHNPLGQIMDGREDYMTRLVWAAVVNWHRECPIPPTDAENVQRMRETYALYESKAKSRIHDPTLPRSVLLEREGRGASLFEEKWRRAMSQWDGKVAAAAAMPRLVDDIETRKDGPVPPPPFEEPTEPASEPPPSPLEYLDIAAIKRLPDPTWIVKGIIPEDGMGFMYGPPGHGKSFTALDLALHIAYGATSWHWGAEINRPGLVMYLAQEGQAGMKHRIEAWQRHHGIADDDASFALVRATLNFMSDEDRGKLIGTIDSAAARFGKRPALVMIDTVSRVLPGADENLQKEMSLFVQACDAIRQRYGATVIGVHHAGKSGDMRGSTVLKGAGDFILKVEKQDSESDNPGLVITCEKMKEAEDGWKKYADLKPLEWHSQTRIGETCKSLVFTPRDEPARPQGGDGMPDRAMCRAILEAIDAAWRAGAGWSSMPQTRKYGRYAPDKIAAQFNIPERQATHAILTWLNTDVLALVETSTHAKARALKVQQWL